MLKYLSIAWDGLKLFNRTSSFTSAAAISFYAFFSLIPIMLLVTASLGFVMGAKAGLLERVIGMIREYLPYLSDRLIGDVRGLATDWKKIGWLGAITLVWSAEFVLEAMAEALTKIFGTERKFGFLRRKVVNLFILLMGVLSALVSIIMTAAAILVKKAPIPFLRQNVLYQYVQSFTFEVLVPFFLVAFVVAVVFRAFSGPHLDFKHAFYGSLFFSALWEAAKHVFAWYVSNFPSYNKVYGSLGTLMLLLLWMFYSANLLLLSASFAKASCDRGNGRDGGKGRKT